MTTKRTSTSTDTSALEDTDTSVPALARDDVTYAAACERGYEGLRVDPNPDETYTVAGRLLAARETEAVT